MWWPWPAVGFAVVLHGAGRDLALALAAALVGFLVYNRPPARVYLGDGGSYLLGTALAVLLADAVGTRHGHRRGHGGPGPGGVPAGEVAFAVVRRRRGHRSLLAGDRGHPYDRLVARGWPVLRPALAYIGLARRCWPPAPLWPSTGSTWPRPSRRRRRRPPCVVAAGLATGALTPDREVGSDPDLPLPARGGRRGAAHAARAFDSNWIAPVGPDLDAFERGAGRAGRASPTPWPCPAAPPRSTWPCCSSGWAPATRCSCPSFTFVATATAVTYLGATPVFVDCSPANWTIDPDLVAEELAARAPPAGSPRPW